MTYEEIEHNTERYFEMLEEKYENEEKLYKWIMFEGAVYANDLPRPMTGEELDEWLLVNWLDGNESDLERVGRW